MRLMDLAFGHGGPASGMAGPGATGEMQRGPAVLFPEDGLLGTIDSGTPPVLPMRLGEKPDSPPPTGFTAHDLPLLGVGHSKRQLN